MQAMVQRAPAPCFFLFDLKKSFIVLVEGRGAGPFFPTNLKIVTLKPIHYKILTFSCSSLVSPSKNRL